MTAEPSAASAEAGDSEHSYLQQLGARVRDARTRLGLSRKALAGEEPIGLGPTEFRLLHFLMTHAERVHSRGQLLDYVWGGRSHIEERTVDVHIRRLRSVLENHALDGMVQTVRGMGYRFSITPDGN